MNFLIITGMSGAGKSQVVKYMEDMGFFCVDNLPPALIPKFAEVCFQSSGKIEKVAIVIDIRGGELLRDFFPGLDYLKESGISYQVLFLESADRVLIKRFKESRRLHPLAHEGRLIWGIKDERRILQKIKESANHIIDTSNLSPKQLKEEVAKILVQGSEYEGLIINIISFGFKYGIPMESDLVFDVRFIANPYYISSMKKLSGKHESVREYVLNAPETKEFVDKFMDMLEFLLPKYVKEGKSQLVVSIGCTGGRHRSVAIADQLYELLLESHHSVIVDHRDIDQDNKGVKV